MVVPAHRGQTCVSLLLGWLLKVRGERRHEGFPAGGAQTLPGGITTRARGCPWLFWQGSTQALGCSIRFPHSYSAHPCAPDMQWGWQASILCLVLPSVPLTRPGRDLPFQQQAGTELVLDNGVTLLGAAIAVSSSNDTLVTVVFTLGQAAPSCISNTSWGFYPSQWDCLNSRLLLGTGRGGII